MISAGSDFAQDAAALFLLFLFFLPILLVVSHYSVTTNVCLALVGFVLYLFMFKNLLGLTASVWLLRGPGRWRSPHNGLNCCQKLGIQGCTMAGQSPKSLIQFSITCRPKPYSQRGLVFGSCSEDSCGGSADGAFHTVATKDLSSLNYVLPFALQR